MKTLTTAIILSILLALFATPASAEGLPAFEGPVCNVLLGGTPGLFQLCDNYCEVRDCDSYPVDNQPMSCSRILATYDLRKTADDPDMPCIDAGPQLPPDNCPCWSLSEMIDAGDLDPNSCIIDQTAEFNSIKANLSDPNGAGMADFWAGTFDGFTHFCTYTNTIGGLISEEAFGYSDAENEACRQQVQYLIDAETWDVDCLVLTD